MHLLWMLEYFWLAGDTHDIPRRTNLERDICDHQLRAAHQGYAK